MNAIICDVLRLAAWLGVITWTCEVYKLDICAEVRYDDWACVNTCIWVVKKPIIWLPLNCARYSSWIYCIFVLIATNWEIVKLLTSARVKLLDIWNGVNVLICVVFCKYIEFGLIVLWVTLLTLTLDT